MDLIWRNLEIPGQIPFSAAPSIHVPVLILIVGEIYYEQ